MDATPQLVLPQANDPLNLVPVQIILVLKAQNQKKINSHRWLFNAIGKMLQVSRPHELTIHNNHASLHSLRYVFLSMLVPSPDINLSTTSGRHSITMLTSGGAVVCFPWFLFLPMDG